MDQLPLEIKYIIADWAGHILKGSLLALSLVNQEWNQIAKTFLNEHIIVSLKEDRPLNIPYDRCILTQARKLSIIAKWTPGSHLKTFDPSQIRPETSESLGWSYSNSSAALGSAFFDNRSIRKAGFYVGGDWSPIIDLIRKIPFLHDVNLFVFNGGPVELFDALSQYHPTCRVSFFSTLLRRHPLRMSGTFHVIDPVWLSSPMLYAIHLTCLERDRSMCLHVHSDRPLQNIVLHSPNLKKIALRIDSRYEGPDMIRRVSRAKVDEQAKSDKSPGPAKIETMSWPPQSEMTAEQFKDWQRITDFRVLRSLNVGCIRNTTLLQSFVDDHPFQQLKRLTVVLHPQKDDDGPEFWQAAESMFNSPPPLTYLCLLGEYTPEFANNVIGYKHGRTLRELGLYGEIGPMSESGSRGVLPYRLCSKRIQAGPIFSTQHVQDLASYCQSLQKLSICMQRYAEPQADLDISKALGRFPFLEQLGLALNCLPQVNTHRMPVPLRELTEFEKGMVSFQKEMAWFKEGIVSDCPRWFIRDCMINCAMSESSVKKFFTQIRTSQARLIHLIIQPLYGDFYQHNQLDHDSSLDWVDWTKRKYLDYGIFKDLASIWTVKQDTDTELQAIRVEPFNFGFLNGTLKYPDELLSIFRSTGILETVGAVV